MQVTQIVLLPLAAFLSVQLWTLNAEMSRQTQRIDHLSAEQNILRQTMRELPTQLAQEVESDLRHQFEKTGRYMEYGNELHNDRIAQVLTHVDSLSRHIYRLSLRLDTLRTLPPENLPSRWDELRQQPSKWMEPPNQYRK